VEVNHAVPKPPFVEKIELGADIARQCAFATSQHDRPDEQMALVYQTLFDRVAGDLGTPDGDVAP
jgi:hypothetical protein